MATRNLGRMADTVVVVEGVRINPKLPDGFWTTPTMQMDLVGKPFIITIANEHSPTGTRYDVYFFDETDSRPTNWGMFGTLAEAVERAKSGPPWLKGGSSLGDGRP